MWYSATDEFLLRTYYYSDSFTILGIWVLGLAVSNINESPLQNNESKTLFLMTSLPFYCIPGLAEIKTYGQKMQDAQVTKSLRTTIINIHFNLRQIKGTFISVTFYQI